MAPTTNDEIMRAADDACQACELQDARDLLTFWRPIAADPNLPTPPRPVLQQQLRQAARKGCSNVVDFLLERGAVIDVDVVLKAHASGSADVFHELLVHGWDINSRSEMTSLNTAVANNSTKLVKWHLSHDADPNLHTGPGGDPLTRATVISTVHVVQSLVEHGASLRGTEALIAAALNNDGTTIGRADEPLRIMKYLLDAGVDINHVEKAKTEEGIYDSIFAGTALHRAVGEEAEDRVQLLLDCGADPNIKGIHGFTPLEAAERSGLHRMVMILRAHGGA